MSYALLNDDDYIEELNYVISTLNIDVLDNSSILITGAVGLVASYLCDLLFHANKKLNKNIKLTVVARSQEKIYQRFTPYIGNDNFNFLIKDVNDLFTIDYPVDTIIHCASNAHPVAYKEDPLGTMLTNIMGISNCILACNKSVKTVFFASSAEVYLPNSLLEIPEGAYREGNALALEHLYPVSKMAGEQLCKALCTKHKCRCIIGRLSRRIYGPSLSEDSKALSSFLMSAVRKQPIYLQSNGQQKWSSLYVGNAVSGILHLLTNPQCEGSFNLSDETSFKKLMCYLDTIKKYSGIDYFLNDSAPLTNNKELFLDAEKIKKTHWKPPFSFEKGIEKSILYMSKIDYR